MITCRAWGTSSLRNGPITTTLTSTTGFRYLLRLFQHGKKLTTKLRSIDRNTLMDTSVFAKNQQKKPRVSQERGERSGAA